MPISPHSPAIFLQHSRSAAVMAELGMAHATTGKAANSTVRAKTPILLMTVNSTILAASVTRAQ